MSRPARAKKRLRVLVVTICSPRPIRAVQRARLWNLYRQPSAVGGETARHVVQPDAVLAYRVLDLGVAIGLQFQGLSVPAVMKP